MVGQEGSADRPERVVVARSVRTGMDIRIKGAWRPVVGSVPTSAARHSVSWRLPDGTIDFWVGHPETEYRVR